MAACRQRLNKQVIHIPIPLARLMLFIIATALMIGGSLLIAEVPGLGPKPPSAESLMLGLLCYAIALRLFYAFFDSGDL